MGFLPDRKSDKPPLSDALDVLAADDPVEPELDAGLQHSAKLVDVESELKIHAKAIRSASRTVVTSVLRIGEHLTQARDLLADHKGGTFGKWCKTECGLGKSTAYRMIAVWESFGSRPGAGTTLGNVPTWALQKLASSPEATDLVLEQIDAGSRLDEGKAREILATVAPVDTDTRPTRSRPEPQTFLVDGFGAVVLRPDRDGVDTILMLGTLLRQLSAAEQRVA